MQINQSWYFSDCACLTIIRSKPFFQIQNTDDGRGEVQFTFDFLVTVTNKDNSLFSGILELSEEINYIFTNQKDSKTGHHEKEMLRVRLHVFI